MFGAIRTALYKFTARALPTPGTGNLAFEPAFSLPRQPIQGGGTRYSPYFNVVQPPQLYYGQSQTLVGVGGGGIPAGTFEQQPLINFEEYLNNINTAS